MDLTDVLSRNSFIELRARARAFSLLDDNTGTELLDPFDQLQSSWLSIQGIVPQADDGCVIVLGKIDTRPTVVLAVEGAYQGGSIGEVSGMKIACALRLALTDTERGKPTPAVLVLETGGVRLQEANLGLAVIAEIHSAIVSLRRYVPVVAVVAGMTGCFGGMAIAAGLCSHLIMTRQARLGLNGPEVIEQEAGIGEFDANNRQLVWSILGGEQRYEMDLADALVRDDVEDISGAVRKALVGSLPSRHRFDQPELYLERLARIDVGTDFDGPTAQTIWRPGLGS